jgi:hypothetical protein
VTFKAECRTRFDGSERLFEACWRDLQRGIRQGAIDASTVDLAMVWLDDFASERVNDERSPFYLYG